MNLYYNKPIQKSTLNSLRQRSYYIIRQTEKGLGVTHGFVCKFRDDVLTHLGKKALAYLESHLDSHNDYGWGVFGAYSWTALERAGMTRSYNRKIKWFEFTNGGQGSKTVHAHLKTDAHGEIEFQCGLQRHMDDTIIAQRGSKKCTSCVRYLKTKKD